MTPQREEAERYLRLARRDEAAFRALLNSVTVDFAVACFHAQQAVEKALKAVMFLHGLEFRRTHDLEELSGSLTDAGINIPLEAEELRRPRLMPWNFATTTNRCLWSRPNRRLRTPHGCLSGRIRRWQIFRERQYFLRALYGQPGC